jgi:hypothetical protein
VKTEGVIAEEQMVKSDNVKTVCQFGNDGPQMTGEWNED